MYKKLVSEDNPQGVEYPEAVTADGKLVRAIDIEKGNNAWEESTQKVHKRNRPSVYIGTVSRWMTNKVQPTCEKIDLVDRQARTLRDCTSPRCGCEVIIGVVEVMYY